MINFLSKEKLRDAISFDNTEIAFAHKSDFELKRALFLFRIINNNYLVKIGPKITEFALKMRFPIQPLIKSTLFAQFCGGETIEECLKVIQELGDYGIGSILDYSVEGEDNEDVFEHTMKEIIRTLKRGSENKHIPFAVFKVSGLGKQETISSAYSSIILPHQKAELIRIKERVNEICKTAYNLNVSVMIDAEETWLQPFIDELALCMMEKYNSEKALVVNTYQMYRNDRYSVLERDIEMAKAKGFYLGVKIVRGAYMEKERARALKLGEPSPIQPSKADTDENFNQALNLCLNNLERVSFVAGTHNEDSCLLLVKKMEQLEILPSHPHIYFSQLLGMSDHISFNLSRWGYNVAKYVPYGPLNSVLPYLFRRAEENTSISGQMSRELSLILKERKRRKLHHT